MKSRSKIEISVETHRILRLKQDGAGPGGLNESGQHGPSNELVLIFFRSLDDRSQNGVATDQLIEYCAELVNRRNNNE